jgi:hypothetical protein
VYEPASTIVASAVPWAVSSNPSSIPSPSRTIHLSRLIAQDLHPERMVGLLSGRPAYVAAAMQTTGISAARTVHETAAAR